MIPRRYRRSTFFRKYFKVEPIDLKKLIVTVNEFLLRSCDILNNFAVKMEGSILEIETRINRVEKELILLENRVGSGLLLIKVLVGNHTREKCSTK